MLSIGDFSRLGQVTVRTLRLYDELGLFKPIRVDRFTSYRYYSIEQLPRLNRILMLKDLGLSLEQIAHLLKEDLSATQLRKMLTLKQAEIEQKLQESTEHLARVESRLRQIEKEGQLPGYDVILKKTEPHKIVSIRQVVPFFKDMYSYRCSLFNTMYQWLENNQIAVNGPELTIYHNAEYIEQNIDMEVAVIADISESFNAPNGNVTIRNLPGVLTMASLVCQSRPQDVGQAIVGLYSWIGENDFSTNGPYREIHLYGRELDLKNYDPVTIEMQIPVVKNRS